MWINRRKLERLVERIEKLEARVSDLSRGPNVYFSDGEVHCWGGGDFKLDTALNAMAKQLGVRWNVQAPIAAAIEVSTALGKSE